MGVSHLAGQVWEWCCFLRPEQDPDLCQGHGSFWEVLTGCKGLHCTFPEMQGINRIFSKND